MGPLYGLSARISASPLCCMAMAAAPDGTEPQRKRVRRSAGNPLAYFDVAIGGEPAGKVVFELFKDVVPKAR